MLDRPRDAPGRTALGAAVLSFVAIVFVAGAMDRLTVSLGIPYTWQVWIFRGALLVVPLVAYVSTKRICVEPTERARSEVRSSPPEAR